MDRGAWWAIFHGVTKSQTQLSDILPFMYICLYNYIIFISCILLSCSLFYIFFSTLQFILHNIPWNFISVQISLGLPC